MCDITFASLNVFGSDNGTLSAGVPSGRDHNAFHHALVMTGPNVKSSVIGGIAVETVTTNKTRARAQPIDSATGLPASNGDISLTSGLASAGATLAAALGTDAAVVAEAVPSGIVVNPALI